MSSHNGHQRELEALFTDIEPNATKPRRSPVRRLPDDLRPKDGECELCGFERDPQCESGTIPTFGGFMTCKNRLAYEAEHPLLMDPETQELMPPSDGPYRKRP